MMEENQLVLRATLHDEYILRHKCTLHIAIYALTFAKI